VLALRVAVGDGAMSSTHEPPHQLRPRQRQHPIAALPPMECPMPSIGAPSASMTSPRSAAEVPVACGRRRGRNAVPRGCACRPPRPRGPPRAPGTTPSSGPTRRARGRSAAKALGQRAVADEVQHGRPSTPGDAPPPGVLSPGADVPDFAHARLVRPPRLPAPAPLGEARHQGRRPALASDAGREATSPPPAPRGRVPDARRADGPPPALRAPDRPRGRSRGPKVGSAVTFRPSTPPGSDATA
jgi:hypothetical protein